MKTLLAITALSLGSAGYVISTNVYSTQQLSKKTQQQDHSISSKNTKIRELQTKLAKTIIQQEIVAPLQTRSNSHVNHAFSRIYVAPVEYFVSEIDSSYEDEIKFSLYEHPGSTFPKTNVANKERNNYSRMDKAKRLFDLKYDLIDEKIYAYDKDQWKLPKDHSYLSLIFPDNIFLQPDKFGNFPVIDESFILQKSEDSNSYDLEAFLTKNSMHYESK